MLLLCRKKRKSEASNLPSWSVSICSNRCRNLLAEFTLHACINPVKPTTKMFKRCMPYRTEKCKRFLAKYELVQAAAKQVSAGLLLFP